MKKFYFAIVLLSALTSTHAQSAEVSSWIINVDGETGYDNILSNCSSVQYSNDWVYVSCTCIPDYDIGPWTGNPNTAANQNFVFKITRSPQVNSGALIPTPLGHIGVWSNGVTVFNAKDAMSYQNEATWHQNAVIVEAPSFDLCLGHPQQQGEYHLHLNPTCLYDDTNSADHSPILGYAFDGFPIYGAYAYANPDGSGGIARMNSSYQMRNITSRQSLPDGSTLAANLYGPAISAQYPLGYYVEDFEFIAGLGDLDEHNGRFAITPEYPLGTYAYYVTIDENQEPIYPYTLGETYYGTVAAGNTGMGSGHNTINEAVTTYSPVGVDQLVPVPFELFPNPANEKVAIRMTNNDWSAYDVALVDSYGREVYSRRNTLINSQYMLDIAGISSGVYLLKITGDKAFYTERLVVR